MGVAVLGLALVVYCWAVWLFFTVERFGDSYLAYCEEVPRWLIGRSAPGDTADQGASPAQRRR